MNTEQERADFEAAYAAAYPIAASRPDKFDREDWGDYVDASVGIGWCMYQAGQAAPVAAQPTAPAIDWEAIQSAIKDYVADYEMHGESEAGRECTYRPNEGERGLIEDAIHGLLADGEFLALLRPTPPQAQQERQP